MSDDRDEPVSILAVDDDPATHLAIGATLDGLGANLVGARSVEEALRRLLDAEFAAVLLDVELPGLDGFETAKRIRGRERSRATPILFVTAGDHHPSFTVRDAYALGAVDYLVKPLLPEVLRSKLSVFIELFRRTRAAARAESDARERLANVLSTVNDMFMILDRDLRYTYVNDRMVEASGIPREGLVGRTIREVFPDTAGSHLERELRRAIDDRTPVHFEFHHASFDRWFDNRAYPSGDGLMLVTTEITEAKKAERAIRRQAGMLDAVLSTSVDHVYVFDREGRYVLASEGGARVLGLRRDEIVGKTWRELGLPAELMEAVERQRERVFLGGGAELHEVSYPAPDGLRHYEYIMTPVRGERGAIEWAVVVSRNITERWRFEDRQRLLAEAGRILGSSLDFELTLAQVSQLMVPGFSDWCGLDLLEDDGRVRRIAVVHKDPAKVELANEYRRRYPPRPEDRLGLMAILSAGEPVLYREIDDEVLARGARDPEHLEILRALGLKSLIVVPMIARGHTLGALTLALSESSRLFGEEDLGLARALASRAALAVDNARLFSEVERSAGRREEALNLHRGIEEKLTLLVEASGSLSVSLDVASVLAAVLDLSSRLVSAHAYAVWRLEAASGRWGIAHASGLSDRYKEETIQVLDRTPRMTETPIVAEDVLAIPMLSEREKSYEREGIRSLLSVPLSVRGELTGTLVFYYRSPHHFSEVDLRVATALSNLAGSAIGTAELYGVLKANDRRKDEFLAMLAHELRNPLAAISNAVQVAGRADDRESREWSLEVIDRQVRHLSRLMDDLLDVSRITRGKVTLKRVRIDIVPVLRTAIDSVRRLVEERRHELTVSLPPGPLWVEADATRLEQIVVNLLTNAAKYTEGGGRISLAAGREGEDVAIAVRDNGVGIPPESLPSMFELFIQGDRTLARSEGGLGIGLTLVKSLAEMHGGSVAARSDGPGAGSEFVVRLPSARPAPEGREAGPSSTEDHRPCRRVLIVDDNVDMARGMARLLKLLGHAVETAYDGPSAVEAARAHRPDYVLLDIGLPGMSGYEVARRLREDGFLDTVIVAVSGYGQEEDRRRSKLAGFDHHFVKPLDHDALLKLIAARQ